VLIGPRLWPEREGITFAGVMNAAPRRLRPELLPLELGLFALVFWADEAGYVPLSKTPFLFLVAWGSLWLRGLLGYWPDLTAFNGLVGNAALLAVYLALNWVLAAFGEEAVWRGYALPRAAEFFGSGARAFVIALVAVNVAFGLAHLYQGPSGVIQATVGGVLLGVLYLVTGRNLLAPILAHGVGNSIDFTVMYFGHYPGVGG